MNIKEIYKLAIEKGIENDFRSKKEINEYLRLKKEEYDDLPRDEKGYFDKEKLTNPYSDSRIHFDSEKKDIKRIFAGIDVTPGSIYIAEELHGDLIINHHPVGLALSGLDDVMNYQIDQMEQIGIPVNIAEKLIHKRISEVARGVNPANHYETVDAAKLMKISLMNVHTPADNLSAQFVMKKIEKAKPRYIKDIMKTLMEIPEYQEASRQGSGPMLFSGSKNNRCGKVAVSEFTGGTDGSKEIYQAMANAGVGTIISMHQGEEYRKAAEAAHINVIVAGHISSDSLGMNLFLDELEKRGMKIIPFGGLIRISRAKNK
ncbi:MAG TPA: Nif3-like dinuclear metal center hexameric protein [Candidatus Moranbacteria bacterium]|nr:Nif3-like dinuclear metal center hexameric protein [Candidatus Moranbacteria bacterium]